MGGPPPSEPDGRFSRIRLSGQWVIHEALGKGLDSLVKDLMGVGLVPPKGTKRVGCSLDADILGRLHAASDKTGLPMQRLLFLCLSRQIG